MTEYEKKVLESMPDQWTSIVSLTDVIYPKRISERTQGLRRSHVRNAISALKREGLVICKQGLYRPYDPTSNTSFLSA